MQNFYQTAQGALNPQLFIVGYGLLALTGIVLLIAVAFKFIEHALRPQAVRMAQKHFFSTFGMTLVVVLMFPLWARNIGQVGGSIAFQYVAFSIGALLAVAGFGIHIWAKHSIRLMWSDGIEIKEKHTLITTGAYAWARHPMYAGLLAWCWGGSLMLCNVPTFALTTFLMLPLMIIRAQAEEKLLLQTHPDYLLYQRNVRMLTLTLRGGLAFIAKLAAVGILGFFIVTGIDTATIAVLVFIHLFLGYSLMPERVAFSYRSKSGLMLIIWAASLAWHPFYYLLYFLLAMFLYGLKWSCPCMLIYDKYQRCPCFSLLGKLCRQKLP